ncbi:CsiV family protein [Marinobacterium stanieri]|uniref:CsiV family protein n=1 Tax=Marinobacterium stanieri TaxID=49186 RepID=UPI003A9439FB
MTKFFRRTALALSLTAAATSLQAADMYKVEMVVFANLNSDDGGEFWPRLEAPDTLGSISLSPWNGYPLQYFEQLPTGDLQLGGDAAALSRSGNYALLYHKGWLQPIGGPSSARKVLIDANFEDYALSGNLSIYKKRFLHAQPNLQLTSNRLVDMPRDSSTPDQAAETASMDQGINGSSVENSVETPEVVGFPTEAETPANTWQLSQSRRMRSKETHYIDHPKFGVLLRIRPVY